MKLNRFLLIAVVLVGLLVAYNLFTDKSRTIKGELRNFAVEDTAAIDRIFLADKMGHQSLLTRTENGEWMVGEYKARPQAVRDLLVTLKKMVVKAPVAKSMQPKVLKDMAGVGQRKVEIYSNGTLLKTIYVGIETVDKLGTYMLIEGSSVPFEVHIPGHKGFLQTRFITDARIWRDPVLFRTDYREIRSINVSYASSPNESFELRYDGLKPSLLVKGQNQQADSLLLYEYMNAYRNVVYEYVVTESFPQAKKDSILSSLPFVTVTLQDKKGKKTIVEGFRRASTAKDVDLEGNQYPFDPDRMYALLNKKDFLLVQYFQFDKLMRSPASFVNR
ncbi:MAG: hypothetical protein ACK5CY_04025 [Bacteroidia bacterium]|jgi:hypothetical protein